jgi:hypothetical protein
MEGRESRWLTSLAHRVGLDVHAAQVADVIASTLVEIEAVLRPVIGQGGFDALYTRCLYLTGVGHPWLTPASELLVAQSTAADLVALRPLLARQSRAQAAAGGVALLQTLDNLLASLIGASLTEQLLGSVGIAHANITHGADAQDPLP